MSPNALTQANVDVELSCSTTLSNVAASDFTSDPDAQQAFIETIEDTSTTATVTCTITSVTDIEESDQRRLTTGGPGINIEYEVVLEIFLEYQSASTPNAVDNNAEAVFKQFTAAVEAAHADGSLATKLQASGSSAFTNVQVESDSFSASDFILNVVDVSPTHTPTVAPTTSPTTADDSTLFVDAPILAAIAVGALGLILLVAACIYRSTTKKKSPSKFPDKIQPMNGENFMDLEEFYPSTPRAIPRGAGENPTAHAPGSAVPVRTEHGEAEVLWDTRSHRSDSDSDSSVLSQNNPISVAGGELGDSIIKMYSENAEQREQIVLQSMKADPDMLSIYDKTKEKEDGDGKDDDDEDAAADLAARGDMMTVQRDGSLQHIIDELEKKRKDEREATSATRRSFELSMGSARSASGGANQQDDSVSSNLDASTANTPSSTRRMQGTKDNNTTTNNTNGDRSNNNTNNDSSNNDSNNNYNNNNTSSGASSPESHSRSTKSASKYSYL